MAQIKSVFNFLKDYNELLNPIVTEIDRQIWHYELSRAPEIEELWSIYQTKDLNQLKILEVRRPNLKPCPVPDESIKDWILGDWENLNIEHIGHKELNTKKTKSEDSKIVQDIEYFVEDKNRVNQFNSWIKEREDWQSREILKKEGLDLYNELFKLYSLIKRESESLELMLGDGHIRWTTEERFIDHPILLQKVNLKFDPNKPSFIIKCDELKTELYTPMLRVVSSINQSMLPEIMQEAEDIDHIADKENNIEFFKRLINVIDQKGKYVKDFDRTYNGPMITYDPVIFLRKRTLGYSTFIDGIIEDIEKSGSKDLPDFFETMVGNYNEHKNNEIIEEDWNYNGIDQDVLLTLPANNEQLKIIKYLDCYNAVLVQGPPGTGKTHTIANLIGHLLSKGKNVLVTSHTEKALTVLKDKVFKDLQSLCISLLSASSQRKELDAALFEIAEKTTSIDLNDSRKKIDRLEAERKNLINKYKAKNQELMKIRSNDYKDIVFANDTITPIDAAKFINKGKGKYNYIPGESNDNTVLLPLSHDELIELYKSNELLTPNEEKVLACDIPDLNNIWTGDKFAKKIEEYLKYKALIKGCSPKLAIIDYIDKRRILELLDEAKSIKESLNKFDDIQCDILSKIIRDEIYVTFWEEVFQKNIRLKNKYEEYRKILFENEYVIPEELIELDTVSILDEIISTDKEVPVNGLNSLLKPKWKKLQNAIFNGNKRIENIEDYRNVKSIINYVLERNKLINKINKLLGEFSQEIDCKAEGIEIKVEAIIIKVQKLLNWYKDSWMYYIDKLQKYLTNLNTYNELCFIDMESPIESMNKILNDVFIQELQLKYYSILFHEVEKEFKIYGNSLEKYKAIGDPFDRLNKAFKEKNIDMYRTYYENIANLYDKVEVYLKRTRLLYKLGKVAPEWTEAIIKREGIHGSGIAPENIDLAWKWNQLNSQIDQINSYDTNAIQKDINKINDLLMENARELAYEKAWFHKIRNTTDEQTQAIEGWRQTMKQLGKGTGKRAPVLLKKARELMPLCQTAIPVWIMPLSRVVENFDPRKNKFDVIIIDEASQADILALSALYLGKKIIIVGDNEQVSPNSVGIKTREINALIEQHLQGIPLNHLYNGESSIYDIAQSSGFKPLMLTEHFRCLPEIINFSNGLSYNYKIKPLRDASNVRIKPAVVPYRVPDGYRTFNKTNKIEAEHIASLICACVENEEYDGKTIGVISLLGQEQAYEIDKLLQTKLDPKEYESREIQCGSPAQFQGDERDVIFLSIVEGPSEKGGPVRLVSESGRNDMYRKRYNVATSRAKDQMWVVYSLNPEIDLKPDDIRYKLIKYAMNPSIGEFEEQLKHAESEFEKEVMKILQNQGYKVYPQWKVGSYRIDMVVEDGVKHIAIECDGERWHTPDKLADDMKRQAILERLGWKFIRIRGSQFYRNPEETMKWVFKELDSYNIEPNYQGVSLDGENVKENELISRVKRIAEQIRLEWNGEVADDEEAVLDEFNTFENERVEDKSSYNIKDFKIKESKRTVVGDDNKLKKNYVFDFENNTRGKEIEHKINNNSEKEYDENNANNNKTVPLFDFRKK